MRKIFTIMMNDRVDKHQEKMELEVLESARDQTNERIMSSHYEHDYRSPPIARVAKAFIRNENGVNNLYCEVEFFEVDDIGKEFEIGNKLLTIHQNHGFSISYDRSYELNGLKKDVEELQALISEEPAGYEIKKSIEPVSTLTIFLGAVAFIGTSFVAGVLAKAGGDFWDKIKEIVIKNSKIDNQEKLYVFIGVVEKEYYKVEIMINFTNPIKIDFKKILHKNSLIIDKKIHEYYEKSIRVRRIVFNACGDSIIHEYSVYRSGTPFDIRDENSYKNLIASTL